MELDQQRVESFQAKEDTTLKWEAKKALFEIFQEILQAHGRGLGELQTWLQRLFPLSSDQCSYSFKYPWNRALTSEGGG